MLIIFATGLTGLYLSILNQKEYSFNMYTGSKSATRNQPANQKLLVIYSDGTAVDFVMNNQFELKMNSSHKFIYDKCGFHAFHELGLIQTLVGSAGKINDYYGPNFKFKPIPGKSLTREGFIFFLLKVFSE